jgi:hypothetical protein
MDKDPELQGEEIGDVPSGPIKIASVRFSDEAPVDSANEPKSAASDPSENTKNQKTIVDPVQKELPGLFEGIASMKLSSDAAAPENTGVNNDSSDVVDLSEESKDGIF